MGWDERALTPLGRAVRPLSADSLHLTLAFLGELERDEAERAGELVRAAEPRPVPMRLEPRCTGVPSRRPRVLAFADVDGAAAELQAEIAAALVEEGLSRRESKPFWPHLSVARVRRGELGGRSGRDAIAALPPLPAKATKSSRAARLVLLRSRLGRGPAVYEPLATVDLAGAS